MKCVSGRVYPGAVIVNYPEGMISRRREHDSRAYRQAGTEKDMFPAALRKGLEYLAATDFSIVAAGKYEIAGSDIYASVSEYTTDLKENKKLEAHVKYIDIQYIISGAENIGFDVLTGSLAVKEDKLAEKDVIFYEAVPNETDLRLTKACTPSFPGDVHRRCAPEFPGRCAKWL
jgi:YhcH/YjgK/YiaL family protein